MLPFPSSPPLPTGARGRYRARAPKVPGTSGAMLMHAIMRASACALAMRAAPKMAWAPFAVCAIARRARRHDAAARRGGWGASRARAAGDHHFSGYPRRVGGSSATSHCSASARPFPGQPPVPSVLQDAPPSRCPTDITRPSFRQQGVSDGAARTGVHPPCPPRARPDRIAPHFRLLGWATGAWRPRPSLATPIRRSAATAPHRELEEGAC